MSRNSHFRHVVNQNSTRRKQKCSSRPGFSKYHKTIKGVKVFSIQNHNIYHMLSVLKILKNSAMSTKQSKKLHNYHQKCHKIVIHTTLRSVNTSTNGFIDCNEPEMIFYPVFKCTFYFCAFRLKTTARHSARSRGNLLQESKPGSKRAMPKPRTWSENVPKERQEKQL